MVNYICVNSNKSSILGFVTINLKSSKELKVILAIVKNHLTFSLPATLTQNGSSVPHPFEVCLGLAPCFYK